MDGTFWTMPDAKVLNGVMGCILETLTVGDDSQIRACRNPPPLLGARPGGHGPNAA
jgi:hypothetical protein